MVAQPVSFPIRDTSLEEAAENAAAVWAVFNVLDTIPATPETQLAFEVARHRIQKQIAKTGFDTSQIDEAFHKADVPALGRTHGVPPRLC